MPWRIYGLPVTALMLFFGGCAAPLPPVLSYAPTDVLSGRLAVRVDAHADAPARSVSAGFELRGSAQAGELDLSTPLGTLLGQAKWNATAVTLKTARDERRYEDLHSLAQDVLGEEVPIEALFDWLRGKPWPGAPSQAVASSDTPGFEQLGWTINLSRLSENQIMAERKSLPVVTVKAQMDRP